MDNLNLLLQLHTPQELQYYSNLAHWSIGFLFIVIALLALLEATGKLKPKFNYIRPTILFLSGLFLPLGFAHHIGSQFNLALQATWLIPDQRQHAIMAILLMIAGLAELLSVRYYKNSKVLRLVFPIVFITIGLLFLFHPQHGNAADMMRVVAIHEYLGIAFILVGVFEAFAELFKIKQLTIAWIILMLVTGGLLLTYREADMSYLSNPQMFQEHINH